MTIPDMKKTLPQKGKITWIGQRPEKKAALVSVNEAEISIEDGLAGDHYHGTSKKRQVTLIQGEHIDAVANFLEKEKIDPGLLRRNLVVYGVNLLAFKDQALHIGEEVVLEVTGLCHPCSRMETNLGPGGYNAMRGHGGVTAKVIQGGTIKVGSIVQARV